MIWQEKKRSSRRLTGSRKRNRRARERRRRRRLTFASACSLLAVLLLFASGQLDWENPGGSAAWLGSSAAEQGGGSGKDDDAFPENGGGTEESPSSAGQGNVSGGKDDGNAGESLLTVTYLDVGQADCTILQCGGQTMLIDGGGNSGARTVLAALEALGVERIDYVVATHSHEDHIGGLDEVLLRCPTENIIYRREESTTKSYLDFLKAAETSGARWIIPEPGLEFAFGDASFLLLAPSEEVLEKTNNRSVALLVTFGKTRFLFTGDAEAESERAMLELGLSLEVDVYKAGHHGSSTSSTEKFVEAVDPVYAVISCGAGNEYGHPHSEVISRFEEYDVQVYRTDTMGTVTIVSDGKTLNIHTQKSAAQRQKLYPARNRAFTISVHHICYREAEG